MKVNPLSRLLRGSLRFGVKIEAISVTAVSRGSTEPSPPSTTEPFAPEHPITGCSELDRVKSQSRD